MKNNYWWLSGYPKSGNNWLSDLINFVTLNGQYDFRNRRKELPFKLRNIDYVIKKDYPFFRIENPINQNTGLISKKYHNIISFDSLGRELLSTKANGAIYIVRHPLDVCCSYYNYLLYTGNFSKHWNNFDHYVEGFFKYKGIPGKACDSWINNVTSWLSVKELPTLILHYEDLRSDTFPEIKKICSFLDIEFKDDDLHKGIKMLSLEKMQKIQEKLIEQERELPDGAPTSKEILAKGYRFINKGKIEGFREILSEKQIEQGLNTFEQLIEKLGYN